MKTNHQPKLAIARRANAHFQAQDPQTDKYSSIHIWQDKV